MSEMTSPLPANDPTPPTTNTRARRILAVLMVVLLLLLGVTTYLMYRAARPPKATTLSGETVDTKGITWVRSIYGMSNKPTDLFSQTQAAVPGDDGTIYVTDTRNANVMKFTPDGKFLGLLTSVEPSSPISQPSRLAVGPDGLVYICETTLDRIHVLTPDGREAGSFSVPDPVSVAVTKDRIGVGSVSGFAILEKSGKPLGVFGSRGKGPEQFDYVHGIAFAQDGSFYVSDSYNNRLSGYNANGKRRWIIRTGLPSNSAEVTNNMLTAKEATDAVLKGADALQLPLGLTVDGAGRVVVIDMYDCSLTVFNPKNGKFIAKYGDVGAEDGQLFYPVSVSYDRGRDWFTVADALNRRVQIVRIPGSASGAGGAGAALGRMLAGPWRACIFPLLLLLLAIAGFLVARFMKRRQGATTEVPATA